MKCKIHFWDFIPDSKLVTKLQQFECSDIWTNKLDSYNINVLGRYLELSIAENRTNNEYVYTLTNAIYTNFEVARFFVAGSYGRRLSLGKVSIDLVIFLLSKDLPPYDSGSNALLFNLQKHLMDSKALLVKQCGAPIEISDVTYSEKLDNNLHETSMNASPKIIIKINTTTIKIYVAPSLGQTSEEQRQTAYRYMQTVYNTGGVDALVAWLPSLAERSSQEIANASSGVLAFIRVCVLWAISLNLKSLRIFAIEVLAFQVAQQQIHMEKESHKTNSRDSLGGVDNEFNAEKAFKSFLLYCTNLNTVYKLSIIESPAAFVSPWANHKSSPLLTDNYNPYDNLLESLTSKDQAILEKTASKLLNRFNNINNPPKMSDLFQYQHRKTNCVFNVFLYLLFLLTLFLFLYASFLIYRVGFDLKSISSIDYMSVLENDWALVQNHTVILRDYYEAFQLYVENTLLPEIRLLYNKIIAQFPNKFF